MEAVCISPRGARLGPVGRTVLSGSREGRRGAGRRPKALENSAREPRGGHPPRRLGGVSQLGPTDGTAVPTADAAGTREGKKLWEPLQPSQGGRASQEDTTLRQMHAAVVGALKRCSAHSESASRTEQGSRGRENTAPREAGVLSLQGGSWLGLTMRRPVHSLSGGMRPAGALEQGGQDPLPGHRVFLLGVGLFVGLKLVCARLWIMVAPAGPGSRAWGPHSVPAWALHLGKALACAFTPSKSTPSVCRPSIPTT